MKLLHRLLTDIPLLSDFGLLSLLSGLRNHASLSDLLTPQAAEHPVIRKIKDTLKPQMELRNGIAIVPIEGALARKPDLYEMFDGVEDSQNVLNMIESSDANPDVSGILLNIDSPGGFYTMGPEIADAIANAGKPVVAWTGGTMASLAYWFGSQASQVIASRSATVGSIGAYTTHMDYSKMLEANGIKLDVIKNKEADFKAIGIPGAALTDEQRSYLQSRVQAGFNEFRKTVQAARPNVSDDSMRGQTFNGIEAKKAGLVDRVGDMGFALSVLRNQIKNQSK